MLAIQTHWGLDRVPFPERPGPDGFFDAEPQEEALARIQYAVDYGRQACIVEGDLGSGKTLLGQVAAREAWKRGFCAFFVNLRGASETLTRNLLAEKLGGPADWLELSHRIEEQAISRRQVVLVADDADQASPDALGGLRWLVEESSQGPFGGLSLIATTRTSGVGRLRGRLYDLADLKVELYPWSFEDVKAFITRSVEREGIAHSIFDERAIERIFERSQGCPRTICQMARLALLAGAGEGVASVQADIVESVALELATV